MIRRVTLKNFKNFYQADVILGPFTLLFGANASGKSNLRDAFRFLHGVSRGYTLAEIIGEKYGEGGELQWRGIRGGTREITYRHANTFRIEIEFTPRDQPDASLGLYQIEVAPQGPGGKPRLIYEALWKDGEVVFEVQSDQDAALWLSLPEGKQKGLERLPVAFPDKPQLSLLTMMWLYQLPEVLGKRFSSSVEFKATTAMVRQTLDILASMRFFDFEPEAMRLPSLPGQVVLGDLGENLSTVIQAIVEDPQRRLALMEWIKELTPMDAAGFEFPIYADGKTLFTLVEDDGQRVSAYSASEGTLRFLAVLAAMLGPTTANFCFFEELENGIHPARLHLLLDLIERTVHKKNIQIVATTHSPQLLGLVNPQTREYAAFTYRLPQEPDGHIRRIRDLPPEARQVTEQDHLARLFESGWFEDSMYFLAGEDGEK